MAQQGTMLGGRYRILDVLGDGGMARVFRARDERLGRIVAVKILHQHYLAQPQFVHRFEQEARLAAGLSHPNIVAIYDVDREGDTYYIVMEYVEGGSLKNLIARDAPLPLTLVVPITRQLGLALDAAHARGVIHRDIKPENILLTPTYQVKVGDFGIARALSSHGQTATGMVMGSVSYFSPEQAQGQPATAESDLYSSGIVLYEMLTGRVPFAAGNPLATAMQHITQAPAPPRAIVPALPPSIDPVVLKALDKNPARRYHSGAALGDALTAAAINPYGHNAGAGATAGPPATMGAAIARNTAAPRGSRPPVGVATSAPRRRAAVVVPLVAVVLLGGGAAYAAMHGQAIKAFMASGSGSPGAGATSTPTSAPSATATAGAQPIVGGGGAAPSATPTASAAPTTPPSATTTAPAASPTPQTQATTPASATTQGQGPTSTISPTRPASPLPSATTRPTKTPRSTPPPKPKQVPAAQGRITADIITAKACGYGENGTPYPINPSDTFAPTAGNVYAVFHVHNLPRGASAKVLWNFPSGSPYPYQSSYPIFCAYVQIGDPGPYSVTVRVDGKTVGSHDFTVKGKGNNGAPQGVPPAPQVQVANSVSGGPAKGKNHGRGHSKNNGRGKHSNGSSAA